MILADTSVWVDHLRGRPTPLPAALNNCLVLMHSFVMGELVCGNLSERSTTITLLNNLPRALAVTNVEVMEFIEQRKLMGSGIGFVDAHLLASTLLTKSAQLLTTDKRLSAVAERLAIRYVS